MRPHRAGALVLELLAVAVVAFVGLDGLRRGAWVLGMVALVLAASAVGASVVAFRRSTRTAPEGLVVRGWWGSRTVAWAEVSGFELEPHRRGRRDRISALTDRGRIRIPHPDSQALALQPSQSRRWYQDLVDRLEARRQFHLAAARHR